MQFLSHPVNQTPCKTCAFLPDSPERADREKWEGLLLSFAGMGLPFFCHYGSKCTNYEWPAVIDLSSEAPLCGGWFQFFGEESQSLEPHKWNYELVGEG